MCVYVHANVSECPLYGNNMNYSLLTDEEAFRLPGVELRRRPHLYLLALSVSFPFPIHLLHTIAIIPSASGVDTSKMFVTLMPSSKYAILWCIYLWLCVLFSQTGCKAEDSNCIY